MLKPAVPLTTVLKGTAFENRSRDVLREHFSMALRRVGGRGDGGIDLQGWWWLPSYCVDPAMDPPSHPRTQGRVPIRVLAQCKAEEKKIGPHYIREFEGAVLRFNDYTSTDSAPPVPMRRHRNDFVGVFLSSSPFTQGSLLRAYSSGIPLALVHLPRPSQVHPPSSHQAYDEEAQDANAFGTVVFNPALRSTTGLLRGSIEPRWERSVTGGGRPGLWCGGGRLASWTPVDSQDGQEEDRYVVSPVEERTRREPYVYKSSPL